MSKAFDPCGVLDTFDSRDPWPDYDDVASCGSGEPPCANCDEGPRSSCDEGPCFNLDEGPCSSGDQGPCSNGDHGR
jgi:hypothetical protein